MGAAKATLRRNARSDAAFFACHAADRSSKVNDSSTAIDVAALGGVATAAGRYSCAPHAKALVRAEPGWPRAQKSRSFQYTGSRL
jgi:hypothetical protein